MVSQARRQGEFEGPFTLFDLQKYTPLFSNLYILSPTVENHRSNGSGCSYSMRVRSWGTSAERARKLFTPLRGKDACNNLRK